MTMNCHYKQSLGEVTLVYFLVCCLFHQTLNRIFGDSAGMMAEISKWLITWVTTYRDTMNITC